MTTPVLKAKRLVPAAVLPSHQTAGAAGMDLVAIGTTIIPAGSWTVVATGLALDIPAGYEGQVRPRSGLAARRGVVTSLGTIDSDYRGEVKVILFNYGSVPYVVRPGDRIAQLVICPVARVVIEEVEQLAETPRGTGGFGSTGR